MNAKDVERATAFYRDKLGLKYLFSAGKMAFFDCHGIRLMLSAPEKAEFDHPGSILYFTVDDIKATHATMELAGVRFEAGPHLVASMGNTELWMAFFRDSEENLLALMAEFPTAAA